MDPVTAGLVTTAISGASNVLTDRWNRKSQEKQNEKDREFSREMYAKQRQDNLDDWNRQNQYNSPTQQMQRLREAGLSPHLVYGKGADNTAQVIKSSSAPSSNQPAPRMENSIGNAISQGMNAITAYQQVKQAQAQTDNLTKQNALIEADKSLREAQAENERSKKAGQDLINIKYGVDNKLIQFDYGQKLRLADLEYSGKLLDNSMKEQSMKLNLDRFALEKMSTSADVTQKYLQGLLIKEQTLSTQLNNSMVPSQHEYLRKQIEYVKQQTDNLKKTGKLLDGQTAKQAVDTQLAEFELGLQKRFATKKRWLELMEQGATTTQKGKEAMNIFNAGKTPFY